MLKVYWVPLVFIGLLGFALIYLHGKRHPVIGSRGVRLSTAFFIVALAASLFAELIVNFLITTQKRVGLCQRVVIQVDQSGSILFSLGSILVSYSLINTIFRLL